MTPQRHIIKRQTVQLGVPHPNGVHQLQQQLSRICRARLIPIIDKYCSQLSDPDRIHRIDLLDVDLGTLDLDNLEEDLVVKFTRKLPEALAARIRHAESVAVGRDGANMQAISHLELLAHFARTGTLPWWADASRPQLMSEALRHLVRHAPQMLKSLMHELARDEQPLQRIVYHFDAAFLAALLRVLLASVEHDLTQLPRALPSLLAKTKVAARRPRADIQRTVWHSVLFTATLRSEQCRTPVAFCREVLLQIAGQWRVNYARLLSELHFTLDEQGPPTDSSLGMVVQTLHREAAREVPSATIEVGRQLDAIFERLQRADGPLAPLFVALRPIVDRLPARSRAEWLATLRQLERHTTNGETVDPPMLRTFIGLLRTALQRRLLEPEVVRQCLTDLQKPGAADVPPAMLSELTDLVVGCEDDLATTAPQLEELIVLFDRLRRAGGPFAPLFVALRPVVDRLPARSRAEWLAAFRELEPHATDSATVDTQSLQTIRGLLRTALQQRLLSPSVIQQCQADLQKPGASKLPPDIVTGLSRMFEQTLQADVTLPTEADAPPIDLHFSDTDELYVGNAGLVVLCPFLGHFFERLGLLEDKQFKDAVARQRAVGLLGYLATEEPAPAEYQLPLCKVLCGMELMDVFEFGPPVSDQETAQCTNLLQAAIVQAPILGNMSLAGFRGSFLIRRGMLSTRDGAWLLRVERETYDVVLDRFPWTFEWVKLPWMEAPLRVEW